MLLGLLADEGCGAARTLLAVGVDLDDLRSRAWAGVEEDTSTRSAAGIGPVLQQLSLILEVLAQLSTRLENIEAHPPGDNDSS